jgi:hypothetical protein
VNIKQYFPIDLNFVITVNRSQGQTLDKVILAISMLEGVGCRCNFQYAGLYVAFSRVKNTDVIRLLLTGTMEAKKWESVAYIGHLRPGPLYFLIL